MSYKRLESKALHRGAYIGLAVTSTGITYTTNGSLMVLGKIDIQPLKGQFDARDNPKKISDKMYQRMCQGIETNVGEWEELVNGNVKINGLEYNGDYVDYILAKYPDYPTRISNQALVFGIDLHQPVACIAPIINVNEEEKSK